MKKTGIILFALAFAACGTSNSTADKNLEKPIPVVTNQTVVFPKQDLVFIGKPNMAYVMKIDSALMKYNIKHTFAGCDPSSPEGKAAQAQNEAVQVKMRTLVANWDARYKAIVDSCGTFYGY